MEIDIADHPTGNCQVVAPRGQLDLETAPHLESALDRACITGPPRVIVDLAGLTFCDSIGLSTLIVAQRSCAGHGGFLRLARPSPFLTNLLTTVGIRDAIGVYESVDAACAG